MATAHVLMWEVGKPVVKVLSLVCDLRFSVLREAVARVFGGDIGFQTWRGGRPHFRPRCRRPNASQVADVRRDVRLCAIASDALKSRTESDARFMRMKRIAVGLHVHRKNHERRAYVAILYAFPSGGRSGRGQSSP